LLEIQDLYWLTLAGLVISFWWQSIQLRERALLHVKQYCKKMDLQWLDQNLVRKRIRIIFVTKIYWRLERSFQFEFTTTGEHRYRGVIVMLGKQLKTIETDPYEVPDEEVLH